MNNKELRKFYREIVEALTLNVDLKDFEGYVEAFPTEFVWILFYAWKSKNGKQTNVKRENRNEPRPSNTNLD